ncbi:AEC family transporter [Halomonas shantousis]
MLAELFAVMAPVLFGAGIGFFWVRLGYSYPTDFVTRLVFNVGTPSLILASLASTHIEPHAFGQTMLGTLAVLAVMAMGAFGMAKLLGKDWRVVISPMMYPNTGNMGLPVSLYAFGEAGFAYAVTVMMTVAMVQFTFGVLVTSRRNPLKVLLRTPTIYSIAIAVGLMLSHQELPKWMANTVGLLSGLTVPLMLITLGVSLAGIQVKGLRAGLQFSLLRTVIAASVALGIGYLFDLPPLARSILVLQMSMPVAVYNYLFAQRAQREPEYVASLVFCSTLLALAYLPLQLAFLL